ncbi:hypothetical protein G6321_00050290 [Bradyrhizobium barranii subsp. barranii]|uniref:Uncharacterized protein n=1 Tax=Bradyrhizobium barranii subsp. barranii TaxID=2823807 RepID=A0A7Z0QB78_9BRAD|nr:hypothetical protein [Bradyrhizobium barranii]UGX93686.1 hypothetical protein G6321_00050290 [Bradyrhizobium barranii subsp. barranii]
MALTDLNPSNDDHWTEDGLPRLDIARQLSGNPKLTRADLKGIARSNPPAAKPSVDYARAISVAALAVQNQLQKLAEQKAKFKAANGVLAGVHAEIAKLSGPHSIDENIRDHLKRTASHAAAGNVVEPVAPVYRSKLDEVMAGAPRRAAAVAMSPAMCAGFGALAK